MIRSLEILLYIKIHIYFKINIPCRQLSFQPYFSISQSCSGVPAIELMME